MHPGERKHLVISWSVPPTHWASSSDGRDVLRPLISDATSNAIREAGRKGADEVRVTGEASSPRISCRTAFLHRSEATEVATPGEPARLTGAASGASREACISAAFDWAARRRAAENLWDRSRDREPEMVYGRHCADRSEDEPAAPLGTQ